MAQIKLEEEQKHLSPFQPKQLPGWDAKGCNPPSGVKNQGSEEKTLITFKSEPLPKYSIWR